MRIPKISATAKIGVISLAIGMALGGGSLWLGSRAQAACTPPPTNTGRSVIPFGASSAGKYAVWVRMSAPTAQADSFLIQLDGECPIVMGNSGLLKTNTWTWINYRDGNPNSRAYITMARKNQTFKTIGTETNVAIDRVMLVGDLQCVPKDNGDNCAGSAKPKPTPAPANPYACTSKPTLRIGNTGVCVKRVQWFLNEKNNAKLEISSNGGFGPLTQRAVRNYQSKYKLTVDGEVGPQTWKSLEN